jgi:hypothetical protein
MQPIEPGQLFGRLEVIEQVVDGRWRCKCRRCRYDGVIASEMALHRGRLVQCWDCVQAATKSKPHGVRQVAPVVRVRKDEHGWAIPEAA